MNKSPKTILPPFPELYPELLDEWNFEKNTDLDPYTISAGSHQKVWWRCKNDSSHEWSARVGNRARANRGCPYCAARTSLTDPKRSLAALCPHLLEEWHPTKNQSLDPTTVSLGSQKRIWWLCKDCDYEWDTFTFNRTSNDAGCPVCTLRTPSEKNSLATIFPEVAAEWHPTKNENLTPSDVTAKSGKRITWQCRSCLFEWQTNVKNRTHNNSPCPRCSKDDAVKVYKKNQNEKLEKESDFLPAYDYESEERLFLRDQEIRTIFKSFLKIESETKMIELLFLKRSSNRINYRPYYQRNYVWDNNKATYFIESVLIGTEIPPLIFYESSNGFEVIDGRQRFETLKKFHDNELNLTKKGLYSLKSLANKSFDSLDKRFQSLFLDTKIRVIKFTVVDESRFDVTLQDRLKKEIFRRYNSGITPLRRVEVEKAIYINDTPTIHFKNQFKRNEFMYKTVVALFLAESDLENWQSSFTLEKAVQTVRSLLLASEMPIMSTRNKNTLDQFYERYSENIEDVQAVYKDFCKKVIILNGIGEYFEKREVARNRYWYQILYWALSVLDKEKIDIQQFEQETLKEELFAFFQSQTSVFEDDSKQFFYQPFFVRYSSVADFLSRRFNLQLDIYIRGSREKSSAMLKRNGEEQEVINEDALIRIEKPEASTWNIEDLCQMMRRRNFILRPVYQRGEVINKTKSSAIIESILLGIKLPPLYVYKRENGVSEVVDGQQRLLSILGFTGESFLDENGKQVKSEKNEYALTKLKILEDLNTKTYADLPVDLQNRILDFPLSLIAIEEKFNKNFDPVDLFIRLNSRPYPIKENTFEMWNSYIDKEIIDSIKELKNRYKSWFYLTSNVDVDRMKNEELLMTLSYLNYRFAKSKEESLDSYMDVFVRESNIGVRIRQKSDVTKLLNEATVSPDIKAGVLRAIKQTDNFIKRLKEILIDKEVDDEQPFLAQELTSLFNVRSKKYYARKFHDFYSLWYLAHFLNQGMVHSHRTSIKKDLRNLLSYMKAAEGEMQIVGKAEFQELVDDFKIKYSIDERKIKLNFDEKRQLIKKQNNRCPLCDGSLFSHDEIEVDHIETIARGGKDEITNLQIVHKICNRRKGSKFIKES